MGRHFFFRRGAPVGRNYRDRLPVKLPDPTNDGGVITAQAVTVQFKEVGNQAVNQLRPRDFLVTAGGFDHLSSCHCLRHLGVPPSSVIAPGRCAAWPAGRFDQ